MPRTRATAPRRRREIDLSKRGLEILQTGWNRSPGRIEPDELPALWDRWRQPILAAFHRLRPGVRPWGWWEYDAKHPKLLADGTAPDLDGMPPWARELDCGVPRGMSRDEFETDESYLRRHRLLTAAESRLLASGYQAPDPGPHRRFVPITMEDL